MLLDTLPRPLDIDLKRTALIVVDMQNDGLHPGGWAAHAGADTSPGQEAAWRLMRALPALRGLGVRVCWVGWGVRPDLVNIPEFTIHAYSAAGNGVGLAEVIEESGHRAYVRGEWGSEVYERIPVHDDDLQVFKQRLSGFCHTELESVLRGLGVSTLLFAGMNLDQCVLATFADASNLGFT